MGPGKSGSHRREVARRREMGLRCWACSFRRSPMRKEVERRKARASRRERGRRQGAGRQRPAGRCWRQARQREAAHRKQAVSRLVELPWAPPPSLPKWGLPSRAFAAGG